MPSKPENGFQGTRDPGWVVLLFSNCKDWYIQIAMIWVLAFAFQWDSSREEKCWYPNLGLNFCEWHTNRLSLPVPTTSVSYERGSVCLFYAGILFHKVARWTATVQTLEQQAENVTPGRIGNVFFFPTPSFEVLKDKPPLWGQVTSFGRYEKFVTKGMLAKPRQLSKVSDAAEHAEDVEMEVPDETDMEISDEGC